MTAFRVGDRIVGYMLVNDHLATAEVYLYSYMKVFQTAVGITDLVIDMRYNGGGYLDIASQLAFMIEFERRGHERQRLSSGCSSTAKNPVPA